jgi:hypothetical protein
MCGSDYLDNHGKGNLDVVFSLDGVPAGKVACPANGNWKEQALETDALAGRTGTLIVDVDSCAKRSPKLVLDAWITP